MNPALRDKCLPAPARRRGGRWLRRHPPGSLKRRPISAPLRAFPKPPAAAVKLEARVLHAEASVERGASCIPALRPDLRPGSFIVRSDGPVRLEVGAVGQPEGTQRVYDQTCSRLCRRACGRYPQSARKRIGRLSLSGDHRPHGPRYRLCGLCGSARSLRSNGRAPWTLPDRRPPSRTLLRPCGRPPTVLRISRTLLRPCGRRPTVLRTDGRPPRALPDCRPPTWLVRGDGRYSARQERRGGNREPFRLRVLENFETPGRLPPLGRVTHHFQAPFVGPFLLCSGGAATHVLRWR